jgi:acetyl-CoA acetyltransferase family protein
MRHDRDAVIVGAARTPFGERGGGLATWHPVDLAAHTLTALVARVGVEGNVVDEVLMGCVTQIGEQALNLGRSAVLAAGWPEAVAATTIDAGCASSHQALHLAANAVRSGAAEVVIAAGVEVMSRVPLGANGADARFGLPFGAPDGALATRLSATGGLVSPGLAADLLANEHLFEREHLDAYALRSRARALAARDDGRAAAVVLSLPDLPARRRSSGAPVVDECVHPTTTAELAALTPIFRPESEGGRTTAGNMAPIADGAAAVCVMSASRAAALGVTPYARIIAGTALGGDPRLMHAAASSATRRVLAQAGLALDDIDRFEVHEGYAAAVLAWHRELDVDIERVNVNGGAIAYGHPLGASGAGLVAALVHELDRVNGRYGVVAMAATGGLGTATIIERCS